MFKAPLLDDGIRPNQFLTLNPLRMMASCFFPPTLMFHPNNIRMEDSNMQSETRTNTQNKRKSFTPTEDHLLTQAAIACFETSWNTIATYVPGRTPRQCRDRWMNYLKPGLKFDPWSKKEDEKLVSLVNSYGTHWTKMISFFPGRSTNAIKNRWHWLLNNYIGIEGKNQLPSNSESKSLFNLLHNTKNDLNDQNMKEVESEMIISNDEGEQDNPDQKDLFCIHHHNVLVENVQRPKYVLLSQKIKKNNSKAKPLPTKTWKKCHEKKPKEKINNQLEEKTSNGLEHHASTEIDEDNKNSLFEEIFGSHINIEEFDF